MRSVVISGASTGIGAAVARRLAGAGWRVFAGVRKEADGERLAAGTAGDLRPLTLDVTDVASIDAAVAEVSTAVGGAGLDALVNNAGIAVGGPVEHLAVERWREQLEVNVIGQVACTRAFLPLLLPARGRIVFTGSISGRVSVPLVAPYAASKHAIEAIAEAMRHELRPAGVHTVLVEPGVVRTEIWDKAEDQADEIEAALPPEARIRYAPFIKGLRTSIEVNRRSGVSADECAAVFERALTAPRPKARYLVGLDAKAGGHLVRVLPDRVRDLAVAKYARL